MCVGQKYFLVWLLLFLFFKQTLIRTTPLSVELFLILIVCQLARKQTQTTASSQSSIAVRPAFEPSIKISLHNMHDVCQCEVIWRYWFLGRKAFVIKTQLRGKLETRWLIMNCLLKLMKRFHLLSSWEKLLAYRDEPMGV